MTSTTNIFHSHAVPSTVPNTEKWEPVPVVHALDPDQANASFTASVLSSDSNLLEQPRWVILLTMCFRRKTIERQQAHAEVYLGQLNRWLKETNFHIFVVETSGTPVNFTHPRLSFLTFDDPERTPDGSSSILEANALIFAAREMEKYPAYRAAEYVLKVTGRYFLEDLEQVVRQVTPSKALYLQRHRNADLRGGWQNSEYFGIRKVGLQLLGPFVRHQEILMEVGLHRLSTFVDWDFLHPNKGFPNKMARGGDKQIIDPL